ncbi:hypothetical protein METHB2_1300003 [Candidatus Methylobacter favarea]|uniref:Uncharacterized protein n=1 Tax=Candidatus Methylobacter favarea TaxID=2707345 RepID=A0A8S0WYV8_9GAMM|nr:hypothetical protein [Candidatus Methylobacter favarea]CAA9889803.1 hypothetical protein METHB2_1300003 [Candidatus Methylobacter favarea]
MQAANVRRESMNQSTTIAHQLIAKASTKQFNIDKEIKPSFFELLFPIFSNTTLDQAR